MKALQVSSELLSRFKELFVVDFTTGDLHWSGRGFRSSGVGKRLSGKRVGTLQKGSGYLRVGVDGTKYLVHRIIWMLHTNKPLPIDTRIDHIDGDKINNVLCNLREATTQQNNSNCKGRGGTSKYKGVHYRNSSGKWIASSKFEGKSYHLGCFECEETAAEAYNTFAKKFFHEFAKTNSTGD